MPTLLRHPAQGAESMGSDPPLLEVRDLVTRFRHRRGVIRAVNGISFSLNSGEALGIVGESGCGKSVTALSLLGLLAENGWVEGGSAIFQGRDLLTLSRRDLRAIRGRRVAMVFQDPMTSLNPVLSVGFQLREGLRRHLGMNRRQSWQRSAALLELVGISDPRERMRAFPHQLSGGQRQRVMIAMALSCDPSLLIADEPTTALDVTIQAQIVELVKDLQRKLGLAILWITHDLALLAGLVDRVVVMYGGYIIEQGPVQDIFENPCHPYTRALLETIPSWTGQKKSQLASIPGSPPDSRQRFEYCPFAPRCSHTADRCRQENPPLRTTDRANQTSACWRWEELHPWRASDDG